MTAGLTFLDYATIRHDARWHLACHAHQHHEIIAVESGAMRAEIDGRTLTAGAGDVLFYHAGVPHTEWTDPHRAATTLCLSYSGQSQTLADCTHDDNGRVRQMLRWIDQDRAAGTAGDRARTRAIIAAIVAELSHLAASLQPTLVTQTRLYVQEHLAGRITLADLAARASLSKYHFIRRYRELASCTPGQDVRRMRIERARSLVVSTPWPLRHIAEQVGLSSEFHLSRLFRQHLGVCPTALRRQP
ncbi:MAG: AraC family transcriptional regulator [Planctomycetaceae bacterium]|nr:AraC family transcriptional regulator [Planctomycetaceae bacterium]